MVSLINFGNISTQNGRTVALGGQSGLDTASIIDQLATAKRLPATKFEDNIKINNNKISALTTLKTKLTTLQDAVAKLRNPVGVGNNTDDAFEARTAFLSISTGDTASNFIGISAKSGAPIGKYQITVGNVASAQTDTSEAFANLTDSVVMGDNSGGPGTGKFNAGTFKINYTDDNGAAQSVGVTLNAGANLATVRDTINAQTGKTGVSATIVKLSDTDYRLKLSSTDTGLKNAYTFTNDTGTKVNFTTVAAQDAHFTLDNQPIVRSSNVIDDLINNTTLTLYQQTNGATVTADIDKDYQGIAQGVASFMDAYNDIRTYYAQQNDVDQDGKLKDTSYLHDSSVMNALIQKLSSIVGGGKGAGLLSPADLAAFGGTGSTTSAPKSLADLGIFFTSQDAVTDGDNPTPAIDNMLSLDVSQLNDYLQKYFSQTRDLFEFSFISDNSQISSYTRSNAISDNNIGSFSLSIDHTAKTVTVSNLKDPSGNALSPSTTTMDYVESGGTVTLKGKDGTPLAGMEFFYTGDKTGTTTANIEVSQGVGDVMFNALDTYINGLDGATSSIDQEIQSLKDQNTSAQASVTRIDDMVTGYRDQMLNKFAALESLISASNQTLMLLDAQSNARNNSN